MHIYRCTYYISTGYSKCLPPKSQEFVKSYFRTINYKVLPFVIVFDTVVAFINVLAIYYPQHDKQIFTYQCFGFFTFLFIHSFLYVYSNRMMMFELKSCLRSLNVDTPQYASILKVYKKLSFNTSIFIPAAVIMMATALLPACWPYLLRKGSYIVPMQNVLMCVIFMAADVLRICKKRSQIVKSMKRLSLLRSGRVIQGQDTIQNNNSDSNEQSGTEESKHSVGNKFVAPNVRLRPQVYSTNFHVMDRMITAVSEYGNRLVEDENAIEEEEDEDFNTADNDIEKLDSPGLIAFEKVVENPDEQYCDNEIIIKVYE